MTFYQATFGHHPWCFNTLPHLVGPHCYSPFCSLKAIAKKTQFDVTYVAINNGIARGISSPQHTCHRNKNIKKYQGYKNIPLKHTILYTKLSKFRNVAALLRCCCVRRQIKNHAPTRMAGARQKSYGEAGYHSK